MDTLWIDLAQSQLLWKGTKMRGLGKHEGEIAFQKGYLLGIGNQWTGGYFEIDMEKIRVTDIPETDPIPIKNLTDHLKNEDFFDVGRFPVSTFTLIEVKRIQTGNLEFKGNLEIKGISKMIRFEGIKKENQLVATFSIDRFEWNIAYEGSWADRTLVDRNIEFRVRLVPEGSRLLIRN